MSDASFESAWNDAAAMAPRRGDPPGAVAPGRARDGLAGRGRRRKRRAAADARRRLRRGETPTAPRPASSSRYVSGSGTAPAVNVPTAGSSDMPQVAPGTGKVAQPGVLVIGWV